MKNFKSNEIKIKFCKQEIPILNDAKFEVNDEYACTAEAHTLALRLGVAGGLKQIAILYGDL